MTSFSLSPRSRRQSAPATASFTRLRLLGTAACAVLLGPAGSLVAQFLPGVRYASTNALTVGIAFGPTTATGWPDMVVGGPSIGFTRCFDAYANPNTGCGIFGAPAASTELLAGGAMDLAVAEIDGVGPQEVVVLESLTPLPFPGPFQVRTFVAGAPVQAVATATLEGLGAWPQMLVRDFDGDGDNDVLVLGTSGTLYVHDNLAGTLQAATLITLPPPVLFSAAVRFATGSFNADHLPDLVVLWDTGTINNAQILYNATTIPGTPVWAFPQAPGGVVAWTATNWAAGAGPFAVDIVTGDFDGDGCDDFVVGGGGILVGTVSPRLWYCRVPRTVAGWPGFLTLPAPSILPDALVAGVLPGALISGDFDLDGDLDLAYTASAFGLTPESLHIRPNSGAGTTGAALFPNNTSFPEQVINGFGGTDLAASDLDGDGDLDLGATGALTSSGGNFSCIYCNDADLGRCHHVVRAGIDDAFALPPLPLVERSCPRASWPALPALLRFFDDVTLPPAVFAHTFEGVPDHIVGAKLYVHLKETFFGGNASDRLSLDFGPTGPEQGFALSMPVPAGPVILCLDLAKLPGGLNLLPRLERANRLDVHLASNTAVDFLRLEIATACHQHDLALKYNPNGGADTFYHTPWVCPGTTTFFIDAGASHANGLAVVLLGISNPLQCVGFESLCLWPDFHLTLIGLDNLGRGSTSITLSPPCPVCLLVHTQALVFDTTITWPAAKWSDTISDYVQL